MKPSLKPLFLLADSSPLFWRGADGPFLDCLRTLTRDDPSVPPLRAAYLGASNGDVPEFYELFTGAMSLAGITHCRMIPSRPTGEDLAWLSVAHVILLAGGDPLLGWETFRGNGVESLLRERHRDGAVLMGISAGAMQLGTQAWSDPPPPELALFPVLGLAPFIVGVHEAPDWTELKRALRAAGPGARGIGIPLGGGARVHPDGTLEPLRHALVEFRNEGGTLREGRIDPRPGQSLVTR
ncbi:type 1 glutamine amidotransferase-like domain-containing protein [Pyxidicoccus fallax]|uniref:Type 1 glutamine amidotransferase-like domain-containing protein n=1 Tax=Pyxidicoccus fallax TaxID=394095 RepID=A0A848LIB7_9BACT|nr:Type 1 glutamine amidotransferase-like domain-containing protein [Pyxidicoccus fallax]NMO17460.1 type 1 glutamine amidotransferase-like domain-containing protein [Pyxidicoccus fallax]NPC80781.1 type 1 glutamine amidotransferase-like domain-containing protein [Pyxidicoccus fallax]